MKIMFLLGSVFPAPGSSCVTAASNTVIKMSVAECTARLMNTEITLKIESALPREMYGRAQRQSGHTHANARTEFPESFLKL